MLYTYTYIYLILTDFNNSIPWFQQTKGHGPFHPVILGGGPQHWQMCCACCFYKTEQKKKNGDFFFFFTVHCININFATVIFHCHFSRCDQFSVVVFGAYSRLFLERETQMKGDGAKFIIMLELNVLVWWKSKMNFSTILQ